MGQGGVRGSLGDPWGMEKAALEGRKITRTPVFWFMRGHCEPPCPLVHSGCLLSASSSPPRPLAPPASAQPPDPLPTWVGEEVLLNTIHFPHENRGAEGPSQDGQPTPTPGKDWTVVPTISYSDSTSILILRALCVPGIGHAPSNTQQPHPLSTGGTMWVPLLLGSRHLCPDLHYALSH